MAEETHALFQEEQNLDDILSYIVDAICRDIPLEEAADSLLKDSMTHDDIEIIKEALKRARTQALSAIIDGVFERQPDTLITHKDLNYDDIHPLGLRFMNRDFSSQELSIIKLNFKKELAKEIYPRVVYAFGKSAAEERLTEIRNNLKSPPSSSTPNNTTNPIP